MIDFRLGRWEDVLADVGEVDAVITDPPYGARTHSGHRTESRDGASRRELTYSSFSDVDVSGFVSALAPRVSGWWVVLTSHDLWRSWEAHLGASGLYVFHPIPCVIPGMTVRQCGDGPSSWAVWACVARPRSRPWSKWGTLRGAYSATQDRDQHIGGKPLGLMRALIRDYTRPGDLVCDPCAGGATTLIAAAMEGRRAIGCEMDPDTYAKAKKRIAKGYTPDLFV